MLLNLLSNAVKFTESGEVIAHVDAAPAEPGMHRLHFAVRDTGIGIPKDRMNRLFESFSQVDASTSRRYGGTGLGLAISKRIIELMDGTMWVESEEGKGSTFHIALTAPEAEVPAKIDLDGGLPKLAAKRILVVDDNATNREIVSRQTRSWGMEPVAVALPSEALALIENGERFDVAALDMLMPEMDGCELARRIRRQPNGQELPLVLLTSLAGLPQARSADEFSVQLTKPVRASQLYNALVSVFTGPELESAAPDTAVGDEVPETSSLRILLAEDNPVNQKVALKILDKLGYRADVASNGLEVLEALERETLRRRPDGRADAGDGRSRRVAPDLRAVAGRVPPPHHRDDGERHDRGPRGVLRRRDGRLPREAGPPGGARRGAESRPDVRPRLMRSLAARSMDRYLPEDVRTILEERFWHTVEEKSTVEVFSRDRTILGAPDTHPALFADHGVVHARDVAAGTLELADVVDGRLLPARPVDRREFVTALAVLIAYIHDVGMNDPTPDGRRAHAIYAAQMPFSGAMDDVLARLWESGGPVVSRICSVGAVDPFSVPDDVVLRELASLALAHSKSMVPATLHADFRALPKGVAASGARRVRGAPARRSAPEPGQRPAGRARRERTVVRGPRWRRVRLGRLAPSRAPGAHDRRRRRSATGARGGRAPPAWLGSANGRRVRDLHRRRDGSGRLLAPHLDRRPAVSSPLRQPDERRRSEPAKGRGDAQRRSAHLVSPR